MKNPSTYGTNTTTPVGRANGQFNNDPGGSTGSGIESEADNDNIYAVIAPIQSWKEGGISDSDETTNNSDMRDAIEEMVGKKVVGLDQWVSGTTYSAPGELTDLVMWKGFQFVNVSDVNNIGNDPLLNPKLWFKIPKVDNLMDQYFGGLPQDGELLPVADRSDGQYLQHFLSGNYRLGGNGESFYNFNRVNLDGTVLTGNAELETIFDVGGANEYFNLDLIAPDVLGTRTLIDMSSRHITPMSVGGENNTLAESLENRFQGHAHIYYSNNSVVDNGIAQQVNDATIGGVYEDANTQYPLKNITTDTTNGTPRTGLTTRSDELTVGSSYIIVMIPA